MRSKATAEMRTPEPKAMTEAMTTGGTRTNHATSAPNTSAAPPSRPHSPACSHVGTALLSSDTRDSCPTASVANPSVGVAEEVAAEVRHGEGDLAALGGVDQSLLDQRVARRREGGGLAAQGHRHLRGRHRGAQRAAQLGHGVHVLALGGGGPVVAGAEEAHRELGLGD